MSLPSFTSQKPGKILVFGTSLVKLANLAYFELGHVTFWNYVVNPCTYLAIYGKRRPIAIKGHRLHIWDVTKMINDLVKQGLMLPSCVFTWGKVNKFQFDGPQKTECMWKDVKVCERKISFPRVCWNSHHSKNKRLDWSFANAHVCKSNYLPICLIQHLGHYMVFLQDQTRFSQYKPVDWQKIWMC